MERRGRKSQKAKIMKNLKGHALISTSEAKQIGISNLQLHRLAIDKKIIRMGSGLYYNPNSSLYGVDLEYAVACRRLGPESALGGLTALFHYQLTEEVPGQIWALVTTSARPRIKEYRIFRTSVPLNIEIENHKYYRMVTVERALLEALKYASKIGLDTALGSIRKALREKITTLTKLENAATRLKMKKYVVKHWEAIIS